MGGGAYPDYHRAIIWTFRIKVVPKVNHNYHHIAERLQNQIMSSVLKTAFGTVVLI